jgi:hypothetical protein
MDGWLAHRAFAISARQVTPDADNPLKLISDGRAAATDENFLWPKYVAAVQAGQYDGATDIPASPGKVDYMAAEASRIFRERGEGLQIIFSDMGVPGGSSQYPFYDVIKDRLSDAEDGTGEKIFPRDKVRFVHEAKSHKDRERLFEKCRVKGAVRGIVGSTPKLGEGTNIQTWGYAIHHMTSPLRPGDLTQDNGRLLRPGCNWPDVYIVHYVTKGSHDDLSLGFLIRKQHFIGQILNCDLKCLAEDRIPDDPEEASDPITEELKLIMQSARDKGMEMPGDVPAEALRRISPNPAAVLAM